MAKKEYSLLKTTKLSGKFVPAGETVFLDEKDKVTKQLLDKNIIRILKSIIVEKKVEEVEKPKKDTPDLSGSK